MAKKSATSKGHGSKAYKRSQVIAALLECATQDEACKRISIGRSTLARWMRDPTFLAEYEAAAASVVTNTVRQLRAASEEAVATLRRCLNASREDVKVSAARALVDHMMRLREVEEFNGRLAALEATLSAKE